MVQNVLIIIFGNGGINRYVLCPDLKNANINNVPFRSIGHGNDGNLVVGFNAHPQQSAANRIGLIHIFLCGGRYPFTVTFGDQ